MKYKKWDRILSVEVDEIDDDHRKLLNIFSLLHQALADGEFPDYQLALLEELINCTVWHFSHEERLMLKHGYEDIEEHKGVHRQLVESVREFQTRFTRGDKSMLEEDIEYLERWLTEHILTDDMRLGAYLSRVM